ncbi:MAG: AAA family ATPase, partial [Thermofilum sp.]
MIKKLPIGISSFEEIRKENYYYVDKTHYVAKLVNEGKYYFLSRPRRFGKSLFVDTLKQAFLGRRELFEGLYLQDHWDWSETYPVIHLDFGGGVVQDAQDLIKWILFKLRQNQSQLKITCEESEDYRNCFEELIVKSAETYGKRVVVLIDEYDKPILDRIEERDKAREIREVLKSLYSVLKPLDSYLKFVFITGVTKFSKVSLFSGLNQLQDITLSSKYATICGYTQAELERVFGELFTEEELQGVKFWYNGYSFCGEPVYNPFDVLLYLSERKFRSYWFETGTPSFLVKLMLEKRFYLPKMEEFIADEYLLGSFDVDEIEVPTLLFQAGYLTVKEWHSSIEGTYYVLSYPNKEVRSALNRVLFYALTSLEVEGGRLSLRARESLKRGDVECFGEVLKSLFAGIPFDWYRKNNLSEYEGYYGSVVYSFLQGVGFDIVAEDVTSKGRLDLAIRAGEKVYLLEFKVVEREGEESALEMLKRKGYAEKYKATA